MKTLWISHAPALEGAELVLLEAVTGLQTRGVEVHVVVPGDGRLVEALRESSVATSIIPLERWTRGSRLPRGRGAAWRRNLQETVPRLRRLLGEVKPDVVVTNTLTAPAGALATRGTGLAHVWYVHELMSQEHELRFDLGRRISLALVNRLSRRIIVNSKTTRDAYASSFPAAKVRVLYPAVHVSEPGASLPGSQGGFGLIVVGHVRAGKRQEDAVRALACLRDRGVAATLTLLGDEEPGYAAHLRGIARDHGVAEQVRFLPFTRDPAPHVVAADVVVVCSRDESFGRVVVEGMKLGRVVVGADSGGVGELISDGLTGLLYRPADVEDLARRLESLHRDRDLREQVAARGRSWARSTFDDDRYVTDLHSLLEDAVSA